MQQPQEVGSLAAVKSGSLLLRGQLGKDGAELRPCGYCQEPSFLQAMGRVCEAYTVNSGLRVTLRSGSQNGLRQPQDSWQEAQVLSSAYRGLSGTLGCVCGPSPWSPDSEQPGKI